MDSTSPTQSIDRRGKTISTFIVFDAAAALREMRDGEVLEILCDDFGPLEPEIASWCEAAGHRLIGSERLPAARRFRIAKGSRPADGRGVALVISSDGLEELLTPLGFALAAALEGSDVALYVQGPAVRVLSRGFQPKLRGWSRPFTQFAAAGLAQAGHIPAQDKLRQLRSIGARIYMCGPSMQHFKLSAGDLIFDDLPQVEYLTFMAVMQRADVHIYT